MRRRKTHPRRAVETHTGDAEQRCGQECRNQGQKEPADRPGDHLAGRCRVIQTVAAPSRPTAPSRHTDIAAARGTSCPASAALPIKTARVQLCGRPSTNGETYAPKVSTVEI